MHMNHQQIVKHVVIIHINYNLKFVICYLWSCESYLESNLESSPVALKRELSSLSISKSLNNI